MEEAMTNSKQPLRPERLSRQWRSAIGWRTRPRHPMLLAAALAIAAAGSLAAAHDASHHAASTSSATPAPSPQSSDEAAYLAENDAAMKKMMTDMSIKPSGDIDADFVAMMVPHHQGAVDMAQAELRYGRNEQLRRIAQEIIVDQLQEIAAMHLALGQPLPPAVAAPTQPAPVGGSEQQPTAHNSMKAPRASTTNQEH
jgi:hypothetical protein